MALKIQNVRQLSKSVGANILIYGEPGVGKTTLLASVPDPSRILILSAEAGLRSIGDQCPDSPAAAISTTAELREALAYLKTPEARAAYDFVGIDSLSELASISLAEEMKKTANGVKAYGEMGKAVSALVRDFRDLPYHVIFLAAQGQIQDDNGLIRYAPDFPGKMLCHGSAALTHLADFVWPMLMIERTDPETKETVLKRVLLAQPNARYSAKSRKMGAPKFVKPDLKDIIELIDPAAQDG